MSAEAAAPATTAEETPVAAVVLKPKNTHRLNRILRKPKAALHPRPWHTEEAGAPRTVGVPAGVVARLLASLTAEEKERAATGQDPLTPTQEALARRAARFGMSLSSSPTADSAGAKAGPVLPTSTIVVDAETLRRREERFKPAAQ